MTITDEMYRRFNFAQIVFATVLGVAGGVYIYKPIFEQYRWDQRHEKAPTAEDLGKKE
ncbi:hypothetical protein FKM82_004710 [Ascaphus truei]|uniref:protein PIGBOS1 n=1 Tax=Ascaphus truei TaxID=8439 RepID=UPI003F5A23D9